MTNDAIIYRKEAGVATITKNNPPQVGMTLDVLTGMKQALVDANNDETVQVIVITAGGPGFHMGGVVLGEANTDWEFTPVEFKEALLTGLNVFRLIETIEKPVIGVAKAGAVGGGFEWALNCDFPIWAESARAFFPEVSLNVFVTGAVTTILPAIVGPLKAREMLYLGERYSAADLLACGVAWKVVPDAELMASA